MAARKLAAYVHVGGRVFEPGDTPPKEFADQITNPAAWGDSSDAGADDQSGKKSASSRTTSSKTE